MTITTTGNRSSYSGNGVTTVFSFPNKFFLNTDLVVISKDDTTGVETVKTLSTHYTVAGMGVDAGGTVTMLVAPATGTSLIIYRNVARTQLLDLIENSRLPAEELEKAFDKHMMAIQRLSDLLTRSVKLPEGFTASFDLTLPFEMTADCIVVINPTGDGFDIGPTLTEIVNATAATADSAADAAASAAAAAVSEANAAASAAAALTSETNAETAETNAEAAAVSASTSETNANTSESNASTSETNAAASEVAAATSETNAAASETAAAISAAAAATSYDSFDDRYLGAKAVPPTLDNDGNALLTGALYWDTVANAMFTWDGALWQELGSGGGISLWLTATGYLVDDVIHINNKIYKCLISHTSGTFATDLAALNWQSLSIGDVKIFGTKAAPTAIDATGITFASTYYDNTIYIESTVGAIDVTTDPQITAPTLIGQKLKVVGCHATKTVQLDTGNGLLLRGSWLSDDGNVLNLYADTALLWCEDNRSL